MQKRKVISSITIDNISGVKQNYNEPAQLLCNQEWMQSSCLRCANPRCITMQEGEIRCKTFENFVYERNGSVCPVDAISWNYATELPEINNSVCINCGLCAVRCPVGAIYSSKGKLYISEPTSNYVDLPINSSTIKRQQLLIKKMDDFNWQRHFQQENDNLIERLYAHISRFDGRSMSANVLVRNLMIVLSHECAISRMGDVYTRMDAVYSNKSTPNYNGVIEIELGRDTLEASRGILDDIAVMHAQENLNKDDNVAIVVCLSFPNRRQGYFQVIKDINKVLGLKIQTLSIGALLILAWNGIQVDFSSKCFYVDFDNLSIRLEMERAIGREIHLSDGISIIIVDSL